MSINPDQIHNTDIIPEDQSTGMCHVAVYYHPACNHISAVIRNPCLDTCLDDPPAYNLVGRIIPLSADQLCKTCADDEQATFQLGLHAAITNSVDDTVAANAYDDVAFVNAFGDVVPTAAVPDDDLDFDEYIVFDDDTVMDDDIAMTAARDDDIVMTAAPDADFTAELDDDAAAAQQLQNELDRAAGDAPWWDTEWEARECEIEG
ncbi:hypothetical protein MMC26_006514 [Xylographa opegraphella]|nr:hypothetical protein [Xylographa opegraphella]